MLIPASPCSVSEVALRMMLVGERRSGGARLDGTAVESVEIVPYRHPFTYKLIGRTLRPSF
jgi:hypothetical protein